MYYFNDQANVVIPCFFNRTLNVQSIIFLLPLFAENDVVFLLKSNTISQESCYLNSNNDKSSTVAPISIAKGDVHDAEKTRQAIEFLDSESSMHDVRSKQHQHIVAVNDSGNVSSQDSALSDDKIFDCNGNAVIPIIVPFFRTKVVTWNN